jgi:2-polyprenyl-6-methoxyphenol hydroxylase-like FAD-dependent oxidoreductase
MRCPDNAFLVPMAVILTEMERCSNLVWNNVPKGGSVTTHVTIVGAGIGGLVLARVLHVHGITSTVYEAEPSAGSRAQGGQLDIHADTGQPALELAGLTDAFRAIIHRGAEADRVLAPDGTVLLDEPDDGTGGRPEVLRGELRRILLDALPEGTVRWGHKVTGVRPLGAGRHQLRFADGTAVDTELLVGADGAWSKVRPLLSEATPVYAGLTFVETYLYDADTRHPAAAAAVGAGSMFAPAPGKWIGAHREPNGVLHAYIALHRPADWITAAGLTDPARVAAEFDGWATELTSLITDCDAGPTVRMIHTLPTGHRWDRTAGVTLIGDAAHLSPPSGEGANLAMLDGAELGAALAAHPGDTEAALAAYEAAMFPRSAAAALDAVRLLEGMDAPSELLTTLSRKT